MRTTALAVLAGSLFVTLLSCSSDKQKAEKQRVETAGRATIEIPGSTLSFRTCTPSRVVEEPGTPATGLPAGLNKFCARTTGNGLSLDIALLTRRSSQEALDNKVLFFLPGGPGLSGTEALESSYPNVDYRRFTVVTWDGATTSSRRGGCGPDSAALADNGLPGYQAPLASAVLKECLAAGDGSAETSGGIGGARELEVVREALGLEQVSVLAYSYGAEIATRFAQLYPERVDRVVMDGPFLGDVTLDKRIKSTRSAIARSFAAFRRRCVTSPACTEPVIRLLEQTATWADIRENVLRNGPRVGSGKAVLSGSVLDNAMLFLMARPSLLRAFARALEQSLNGDGSAIFNLGNQRFYGLDRPTYYRSICSDLNLNSSGRLPKFGRLDPITVAFVSDLVPCLSSEGRSTEFTEGLSLETSKKMLAVSSSLDPLTPFEATKASPLLKDTAKCKVDTLGHTTVGSKQIFDFELQFLAGGTSDCGRIPERE